MQYTLLYTFKNVRFFLLERYLAQRFIDKMKYGAVIRIKKEV